MDEEKDRQKTMEVVDTSDQPAEGGPVVDEKVSDNRARMNTEQDELAPLFDMDAAEKFRTRWLAIQSKFVDDPNASVKQADDLVSDIIKSVTMNFADRRVSLEKQWNSGENVSTEDLRVALKRYRSFFDRLLMLES